MKNENHKTNNITAQINHLKNEKEAVILAHIYQLPEIQEVADFVGDSYELAKKAATTPAQVIVFCGVVFMAETAAILNPGKKVVMPDAGAGCPMADMLPQKALLDLKKDHPGVPVVCYVNSSAAIKALSDVCCTSSNAVKIINSLPSERIIFVPDKYLGDYARRQTKKNIILYNGYCPTHIKIIPEQIIKVKQDHPQAEVLVHGETTPAVQAAADHVLSTGQMRDYIGRSSQKEFIIGTELGILHTLKKLYPDKHFYQITPQAICPNMKKTTLDKLLSALQSLQPQITVDDTVAKAARQSLQKMMEITER